MYKIILDGQGNKRGSIYQGSNSHKAILSRDGTVLGYYNESADKTFDNTGGYVGPGDQRMALMVD